MEKAGSRTFAAAGGIVLYLVLALAPLLAMVLPPLPPARESLRELSVALAFCGAGILGMQVVSSSRSGRSKRPYGIDAVYRFHRQVSFVGLALVVVHPAILVALDPALAAVLLDPGTGPARVRAALSAVVLLVAIVVLSVWRRPLGIRYEPWRAVHGILAVTVIGLATYHILLAGVYTSAGTWKAALWAAYPAAWLLLAAYVRVGKPLAQSARPYEVTGVRAEGAGVWTLSFAPVGHPGVAFEAGQFGWVKLGASPFALEEHPFSFSSAPAAATDEGPVVTGGFEMTVKELGDFTSRIGETRVGQRAYLDAPYGAFVASRHPAEHHVLIAGGIGVTPIMSMLRAAAAGLPHAHLTLLFGAATEADLTFRAEIDSLSKVIGMGVTYVLEKPPQGWTGERGFITADVLKRALPPGAARGEFFVCGPPPMMGAMESALEPLGVPRARVHYERFDLV